MQKSPGPKRWLVLLYDDKQCFIFKNGYFTTTYYILCKEKFQFKEKEATALFTVGIIGETILKTLLA
jgi:hypothetical protein